MATRTEAAITGSFSKGLFVGAGVILLLLGLATGAMHYGMAACPICGSDMTEAGQTPADSSD